MLHCFWGEVEKSTGVAWIRGASAPFSPPCRRPWHDQWQFIENKNTKWPINKGVPPGLPCHYICITPITMIQDTMVH